MHSTTYATHVLLHRPIKRLNFNHVSRFLATNRWGFVYCANQLDARNETDNEEVRQQLEASRAENAKILVSWGTQSVHAAQLTCLVYVRKQATDGVTSVVWCVL